MTNKEKAGTTREATLWRLLAKQRQSSFFRAGWVIGLGLVGAGVVMLLFPFWSGGESPTIQDLSVSVFGCAGMAVGFFLLTNGTLAQLAYELTLQLDSGGRPEEKVESGATVKAILMEHEVRGEFPSKRK